MNELKHERFITWVALVATQTLAMIQKGKTLQTLVSTEHIDKNINSQNKTVCFE